MLKMMIAFFKDLFKFRSEVSKQDKWIKKFVAKKGYSLNPDLMMRTNLEIWISEMEGTFGKRYCPCFEPSGNNSLDNQMLCPCKFIEKEIELYGTCHCALFGAPDLSKDGWKRSSQRLQKEYRITPNIQNKLMDTRGQVKDGLRGLPVPDAMHQLKNLFSNTNTTEVELILETKQELENLQKICAFRGYEFTIVSEISPFQARVRR